MCHYINHSSHGLSLRISLIAEVKCFAVVLLPTYKSHRNVHSNTKFKGPAVWVAFCFLFWQSMFQFPALTLGTTVSVFLSFPNYNFGDCFEMDHDLFLHTQLIIILIFNSFYLSVMSAAATYNCVLQLKAQLHSLISLKIRFVSSNSLLQIVFSFSPTY